MAFSLVGIADLATASPFIRVEAEVVLKALSTAATRPPTSVPEVKVLIDCVKILEAITARAPEGQRSDLVAILVTVLVALLQPDGATLVQTEPRALMHQCALQALMRVGPQYPAEFKAVISEAPQLKEKLEKAVRANAQKSQHQQQAQQRQASAQAAAPKIQLKMDFSAFGSSS